MIQRFQRKEQVDIEKQAYEQEAFWNRIMAEHSKFIRGLLDPTEETLFEIADDFGNEFDQLTEEARRAMDQTLPISEITDKSLESTLKIRDFNTQATEGLLDCKIRSIIIPLLGDHVLRESNHFIRLLKEFERY
jgi:transcriptional regulator with XRE-family HTH domain